MFWAIIAGGGGREGGGGLIQYKYNIFYIANYKFRHYFHIVCLHINCFNYNAIEQIPFRRTTDEISLDIASAANFQN